MAGNVVGVVTIEVDADASEVPDKVKKSATGGMDGVGAALGAALGKGLAASAVVAGSAVAGILGTSLAKGFSRLDAIDQATAKLVGLGNSAADVKAIMNAATAAVKGTSFGLGEAASAAAQFAAAGIPLDGMQRSLTILGSTASVAGVSMSEMTQIFGKVAATGKLSGEVVAQLGERGVPILSMLSKQLGVTTEDVSKMVSSGQIDFQTFQTTLEGALGPAALAMGQTFQGMLSNIGAAMGRMGAALEKPIFEALKSVLPSVIHLFDELTKAATPIGEAIGQKVAPAFAAFGRALNSINLTGSLSGVQAFGAALAPLAPLLAVLGVMAAGALSKMAVIGPILQPLLSPITALSAALGPLGIAFAALGATLAAVKPETLTAGFTALVNTL
ncbi:MAG: hypothetical protein B7X41_14240, partial [Microbacterium sp. 14-71-5]